MPARVTTTYDIAALVGFLDTISFDFFCTFTTRLPIGIKSARRNAEFVYRYCLKLAPETSMFWCAEKFELKDGAGADRFHWHALLKANLDKYALFDYYFTKYGRCQIIDNREPDRQLAASWYCSKYVTKRLADYDIHLSQQHRGLQLKF